jgi:hypothetical protein
MCLCGEFLEGLVRQHFGFRIFLVADHTFVTVHFSEAFPISIFEFQHHLLPFATFNSPKASSLLTLHLNFYNEENIDPDHWRFFPEWLNFCSIAG